MLSITSGYFKLKRAIKIMSTIESASMPGTEVSEKTPVDFGTKAVSFKSQADTTRLLQTSSQIRNVPVQSSIKTSQASVPILTTPSSQKTSKLSACSF